MSRTTEHSSNRQRRLIHEPLEPRMLLTGTDPGWVFGVGGVNASVMPYTRSLSVDVEGNVYVAGMFQGGSIDFDPGPGVAASSSTNGVQGFVGKYAPGGALIWAREMGGLGTDYAYALALGEDGSVYVAGHFRETAAFGDTILSSRGDGDIFLTKLDSDGNFEWTVSAGSLAQDSCRSIAVDSEGSIYIAGGFESTADFGAYQLSSRGSRDAYVAKLDSEGQFQWVQDLGGEELDWGTYSLTVDSKGSVFVAGMFAGTASFGTYQFASAGGDDNFIARLSAGDGAVLWAQQVGGAGNDSIWGTAVDADGCLYATGSFNADAYAGAIEISSNGGDDIFVVKLDPDGTALWVRTAGSVNGNEVGQGVVVDADKNIFLTGSFRNIVDFDPGAGEALLIESQNSVDGFLWKLDADGDYITAKRISGENIDQTEGITVDVGGNVYLSGWSRSETAAFPNGTLSVIGFQDMFVAKLPARTLDSHIVLFSDSFENGEWNGLWVEDSQNDWLTSTQRTTLGSYSAEVDGKATDAMLTIAAPIDLTPYGSAELTFDWYLENTLDAGEYLAVDLFDGSTWTEVARLSGDVDAEDVWHQPYVQIPAEYLVSNFQFRFRAKMSGSDEDANLDNVQLIATSLTGPANQLPVAQDDAAATDEDTSATVNVLANDSDPDLSDVLQVESVTQGSAGAVVNNGDGTLTYTPNPDFYGLDTFSYTISDGRGGTDTGSVTVTVNPLSDAPVAVDDVAITILETPVTIDVLANDNDVDGDPLTLDSFTDPSHGAVVDLGDGLIQYTANAEFTGDDTFTYTISDGNGDADTATVTVTVHGGSQTFNSGDVPKTIADPHPRKGPRPTTSQLPISGTNATAGMLDVDVTIVHPTMNDLTVTLTGPAGVEKSLVYDGADWNLVATTEFWGQSLDGTWILTVTDNVYDGVTGTLQDWSITVSTLSGPGVTVTPTSGLSTTEAGGATSFMVILNSQPTGVVTVNLMPDDTSEGRLEEANSDDMTLIFDPGNWFIPRKIVVIGVDDTLADGDVFYTIITVIWETADPHYLTIDPIDVTITNMDDDDPPAPLLAGFGSYGAIGDSLGMAAEVTLAQVEQITSQAMALWSAQLSVPLPNDIHVALADLPPGQLGQTDRHSIVLDVNASGAGWFVDTTPWDHSEFLGPVSPASGRVDLLSVVTHELGHALGFEHSLDEHDVMATTLPPGTRRLPGSTPLIAYDPYGFILHWPLLLPETRRDVMQSDLIDHTLLASDMDGPTGADIDLLLLPLAPADYLDRPRTGPKAIEARMLNDIADEETKLLDEDLLALLAVGRN